MPSPKSRNASPAAQRMLRQFNLFGLDFLDTVVLAALADERPLLLIGPHGTAKSELLNRIAANLRLEHRHYNASLISFDDLLGYPMPDVERSAIRYLRTPGDLWDAECVFLDEISRCRPETQNKLFSVVHERRVQGLLLPKLRYRWAAMNPPLTADSDPEESYEGSLPLDLALADRFAYVVELPALSNLSPADRLALISRGGHAPIDPPDLKQLVAQTRREIAANTDSERAWAAKYIDALVAPLHEAKFGISGRRAVMLAGTIASVQAAARVLGKKLQLADCALVALRAGLPQRAHGRVIAAAKLTAIHRSAVQAAGEAEGSPMRQIRTIADPVERVARALQLNGEGIDKTELSTLVSEAFALLTLPRRYLFARHVLPLAAAKDGLNSPAYELLADSVTKVATMCAQKQHSISTSRADMPRWNELSKRIARLGRGDADDIQLGNVLLTLALVEKAEFDPGQMIELDRQWRKLFREPEIDASIELATP